MMSHFYARIPKSARRTMATARGHRHTGIEVEAFGWKGGARITLRHVDGEDEVVVERIPHPSDPTYSRGSTRIASFNLWTRGGAA